MLKRTLVFSNPMTLSLRNGQLVLAYKDDPDNKVTIPIEDIGVVIIEHQQVIITVPLMNALVEGNVQVVMCNSRGMPSAMLFSFEGNNLQGENLRNQMNAGEVLKIFRPILESLEKMHATGIIHRDISPDNLLFDENHNLVLIDFGAAELQNAELSALIDGRETAGNAP